MFLSLLLTLTIIGSNDLSNISVPEESETVVSVSEIQEANSEESEVVVMSDEATLEDVKDSIDRTNELLQTIIDARTVYLEEIPNFSNYAFRYNSSGDKSTGGSTYIFNDISNSIFEFSSFNMGTTQYCYLWLVDSDYDETNLGSSPLYRFGSDTSFPFSFNVPEGKILIMSSNLSYANFESLIKHSILQSYSFTDIGDRLTSIDENYKEVNERNLEESEELVVNNFEEKLLKICNAILGVIVTCCGLLIMYATMHGGKKNG